MPITRTPRPTVPDTRRAAYGNVLRPTDVGRPWSHRALELRGRARRANLIVSTREEPKRPEPKTTLWDTDAGLVARRVDEIVKYITAPKGDAVIVNVGGIPVLRVTRKIQVVTQW